MMPPMTSGLSPVEMPWNCSDKLLVGWPHAQTWSVSAYPPLMEVLKKKKKPKQNKKQQYYSDNWHDEN